MNKILLTFLLISSFVLVVNGQNIPTDFGQSNTMSQGVIQAEFTFQYVTLNENSNSENNGQVLLRYGVADNFEIFASYDHARLNASDVHFNDNGPISFGTNVFLFGSQRWWPAVGLITAINFPMENDNKISTSLGLNIMKNLGSTFTIGANVLSNFGESLANSYTFYPYVEAQIIEWANVYVGFENVSESDQNLKGINIGTWIWVMEDMLIRFSFTSHLDQEENAEIPKSVLDFGLVYRLN